MMYRCQFFTTVILCVTLSGMQLSLGQGADYNPVSHTYAIDLAGVETISPDFHLAKFNDVIVELRGYIETTIIDTDVRAQGHSIALSASDPTIPGTSAYGVGEISVDGGLMTKIRFAYGNRGDQHFNPVFGVLGGFTSLALNRTFGYQAYDNDVVPSSGAPNTRDAFAVPPAVVPHTRDGLFRQFAVDAGSPAGPVAIDPTYRWQGAGGDLPVSRTFDQFKWTNGTAFGQPDSGPTRPGKAQIAGIEVDVVSFADILRNSVKHTPNSYTMELDFAPRVDGAPIALRELADAMGFDHFNWYQQVTAAPSKAVPTISAVTPTGLVPSFTAEQMKARQEAEANALNISTDPISKAPLTKHHVGLGLVDALPQTDSVQLAYVWARPDIPSEYVVQSGDTLSEIAERFDVSTDYLARHNSISDPNVILAGSTLKIREGEIGWLQDWADTAPLVWSEAPINARPFVDPSKPYGSYFQTVVNDWESNSLYPGGELETELSFEDTPRNSFLDINNPADHFAFRTELVGVGLDGSIRFLADEFPGIGLAWEWKSNTEIDPDAPAIIHGGVFDISRGLADPSGLAPYVVGGGIFGITSDLIPVPEPSGIALALAGIAVTVISAYIRQRKNHDEYAT